MRVLRVLLGPESSESVGLLQSLLWQGRRLDPTGFYHIGKRYYDANSGRFISADPLGHAATPDLYSFAGGDPINRIDPDGRLNISSFQNQRNLYAAPQGFDQWRQLQRDNKFQQSIRNGWARQDAWKGIKSAISGGVRTFVPFAESFYQLSQGNIGAAVGYALLDVATLGGGGIVAKAAIKGGITLAKGAYKLGKAGTSYAQRITKGAQSGINSVFKNGKSVQSGVLRSGTTNQMSLSSRFWKKVHNRFGSRKNFSKHLAELRDDTNNSNLLFTRSEYDGPYVNAYQVNIPLSAKHTLAVIEEAEHLRGINQVGRKQFFNGFNDDIRLAEEFRAKTNIMNHPDLNWVDRRLLKSHLKDVKNRRY